MSTIIRPGLIVMAAALATATVIAIYALADGETLRPGEPAMKGDMSLEETLAKRRSQRQFTDESLEAEQIAQLCWAAQGITDKEHGYRTAPSAGALYPLEIYVATENGVRHYLPGRHALESHLTGDVRGKLEAAALNQEWVGDAQMVMIIAAVEQRTARKYGQRAKRYVHIEVGCALQNVLLQATAMDLAGVPVGAFDDDKIADVLELPRPQAPLMLIPLGHPAKK